MLAKRYGAGEEDDTGNWLRLLVVTAYTTIAWSLHHVE
jgi:hypothetical protein